MPEILTDLEPGGADVKSLPPDVEANGGVDAPKNNKAPAGYVLLGRLRGDDQWREFGDVKAESPDAAIEKLAEENESVADGIRKEEAEIVAVSKRFWQVRTPSYSKPELRF